MRFLKTLQNELKNKDHSSSDDDSKGEGQFDLEDENEKANSYFEIEKELGMQIEGDYEEYPQITFDLSRNISTCCEPALGRIPSFRPSGDNYSSVGAASEAFNQYNSDILDFSRPLYHDGDRSLNMDEELQYAESLGAAIAAPATEVAHEKPFEMRRESMMDCEDIHQDPNNCEHQNHHAHSNNHFSHPKQKGPHRVDIEIFSHMGEPGGQLSKEILGQRPFCNCSKTKCLKLYCQCYRMGLPCHHLCKCVNCENVPGIERKQHPKGKKYKLSMDQENILGEEDSGEELTCSCKMSFCEKSYCPCNKNGQGCGPKCKCFNCKNKFGIRPKGNQALKF